MTSFSYIFFGGSEENFIPPRYLWRKKAGDQFFKCFTRQSNSLYETDDRRDYVVMVRSRELEEQYRKTGATKFLIGREHFVFTNDPLFDPNYPKGPLRSLPSPDTPELLDLLQRLGPDSLRDP